MPSSSKTCLTRRREDAKEKIKLQLRARSHTRYFVEVRCLPVRHEKAGSEFQQKIFYLRTTANKPFSAPSVNENICFSRVRSAKLHSRIPSALMKTALFYPESIRKNLTRASMHSGCASWVCGWSPHIIQKFAKMRSAFA
jgi:hypothetical protein